MESGLERGWGCADPFKAVLWLGVWSPILGSLPGLATRLAAVCVLYWLVVVGVWVSGGVRYGVSRVLRWSVEGRGCWTWRYLFYNLLTTADPDNELWTIVHVGRSRVSVQSWKKHYEANPVPTLVLLRYVASDFSASSEARSIELFEEAWCTEEAPVILALALMSVQPVEETQLRRFKEIHIRQLREGMPLSLVTVSLQCLHELDLASDIKDIVGKLLGPLQQEPWLSDEALSILVQHSPESLRQDSRMRGAIMTSMVHKPTIYSKGFSVISLFSHARDKLGAGLAVLWVTLLNQLMSDVFVWYHLPELLAVGQGLLNEDGRLWALLLRDAGAIPSLNLAEDWAYDAAEIADISALRDRIEDAHPTCRPPPSSDRLPTPHPRDRLTLQLAPLVH